MTYEDKRNESIYTHEEVLKIARSYGIISANMALLERRDFSRNRGRLISETLVEIDTLRIIAPDFAGYLALDEMKKRLDEMPERSGIIERINSVLSRQ